MHDHHHRYGLSVLLLALSGACTAIPDTPPRTPAEIALRQACRDVTSDAVVLNLAAHPDDEAARTLVYLRRRHGVRTVTVYSTCGEGGQNAIGREIGPALARIRTRETLAAAGFTGTEVRWLEFADFGYSKSADETFAIWGRDAYLRALRGVIDNERPDLVLTNHSPGRGHGHHRASSIALRQILAEKSAAGDAIPLFERAFGDQEPAEVHLDVGAIDDVTGATYARQAYRGWRQHRTQGVFGPFTPGRLVPDRWRRIALDPAGGTARSRDGIVEQLPSVFDDQAFLRAARRLDVDPDQLRAQLDAFATERPPATQLEQARDLIPRLRELHAALQARSDASLRLARRIDALERVVLHANGVLLRGTVSRERLATGSRGELTILVGAPDTVRITGLRVHLDAGSGSGPGPDAAPLPEAVDGAIRIPFGPLADVDGSSLPPAFFRPIVELTVDGIEMRRTVPVRYTPAPRVALRWDRPVRLVPLEGGPRVLEAPLEISWNGDEVLDASLHIEAPAGIDVELDEAAVRLPARPSADERQLRIHLSERLPDGGASIAMRLDTGSSRLQLQPVDAGVPADLLVGLVRGPDDSLELALKDLGIAFRLLSPNELATAELSAFTTLVLDIRAYHHRPDLRTQRDRILDCCAAGGRIVCFYHKPHEWNPTAERPLLAPYPLEVGTDRVAEETAAVTLLQPDHPLWHHPNRITDADFAGWVQERGLNFPSSWDERWTPMLRMADAGEEPLDAALLVATSGRGEFLYCSLALYRQLREGHAGAARLLVNLLTPRR